MLQFENVVDLKYYTTQTWSKKCKLKRKYPLKPTKSREVSKPMNSNILSDNKASEN